MNKDAGTAQLSPLLPGATRTRALRRALRHLRADPAMATLIARIGAFRLLASNDSDLFLTLAHSIIYQQLHGKAAATIFARVCALFPKSGQHFTARDITRSSDDTLRSAGLSRNKLLALRDLAGRVLDGSLPDLATLENYDDEQIIATLTPVRGIGRWTVEMLLIFRLGRADVLPIDDFGVRKGFMLAYELAQMPTPRELKDYGQRWAPYRSVASWYLWRAAD